MPLFPYFELTPILIRASIQGVLSFIARELRPCGCAHRRGYEDPDMVLTSGGAKSD